MTHTIPLKQWLKETKNKMESQKYMATISALLNDEWNAKNGWFDETTTVVIDSHE